MASIEVHVTALNGDFTQLAMDPARTVKEVKAEVQKKTDTKGPNFYVCRNLYPGTCIQATSQRDLYVGTQLLQDTDTVGILWESFVLGEGPLLLTLVRSSGSSLGIEHLKLSVEECIRDDGSGFIDFKIVVTHTPTGTRCEQQYYSYHPTGRPVLPHPVEDLRVEMVGSQLVVKWQWSSEWPIPNDQTHFERPIVLKENNPEEKSGLGKNFEEVMPEKMVAHLEQLEEKRCCWEPWFRQTLHNVTCWEARDNASFSEHAFLKQVKVVTKDGVESNVLTFDPDSFPSSDFPIKIVFTPDDGLTWDGPITIISKTKREWKRVLPLPEVDLTGAEAVRAADMTHNVQDESESLIITHEPSGSTAQYEGPAEKNLYRNIKLSQADAYVRLEFQMRCRENGPNSVSNAICFLKLNEGHLSWA